MDAITPDNISNVENPHVDILKPSGFDGNKTKGVFASEDDDKPDPSGGGDNETKKVSSIVCFFAYDPLLPHY